MGAWIEIFAISLIALGVRQSHPSWVRGLKYSFAELQETRPQVAPFVGAWIEISSTPICNLFSRVAPFVGAWIEMGILASISSSIKSHPSWVRGLKFNATCLPLLP